MPLYLAFKPPMMLPTSTLSPGGGAATSVGSPSATSSPGKSKLKRALYEFQAAWSKKGLPMEIRDPIPAYRNANAWFWLGVISTAVGSVMYFCF